MPYCSRQDLLDRLSEAGVAWLIDDDQDGAVSEAELAATLDRAIELAEVEIDLALEPWVRLPTPANPWLRERAIELAVEQLLSRKGPSVPAASAQAAGRARGWLEQVRVGKLRVPRLRYDADTHVSEPTVGLPRIAQVGPASRRSLEET